MAGFVGIVDYGMGNLRSVYNALDILGASAQLCQDPEQLRHLERIILPGVGAFGDCMANLHRAGFVEALDEEVCRRGKPILGICLGMQAMARKSFEGGEYKGLGWFDAEVVRLQPADLSLRVPQIGWNDVTCRRAHPLFLGLPKAPDFYFVHSYSVRCSREDDVTATCEYGGPVTAAVASGNIFATQFHPEKSQDHGLKLLENFMRWKPD
jgi:glutamine amidotransferase